MRPFDMDSILKPGSQLPVQTPDIFSSKHLPYFSNKPYETTLQSSSENFSATLRQKEPEPDSPSPTERHIGCKCGRSISSETFSSPESSPGVDAGSSYASSYEVKRKPSRSVFAPSQIGFMEGIYHGENKTYLTADNRRQIAKKTGLSETQVKRWWQNRRQKDKNRLRDSLQSLNHFLPSMMYSCEPTRAYRNPYIAEGSSVSNSIVHLTSARHSQFLLQTPTHNLITRT